MAEIKITPLFGKPWDLQGFKTNLQKSMREEAKEMKRLFQMTTDSWQGSKPRFNPEYTITPEEISMKMGPSGSDEAVSKWAYLDGGTRIRWAVMSRNWKSKTVSGRLKSRRGRGGVVIAGRKAMQARNIKPRPGIQARNWTQIIEKRRRKAFGVMLRRDFETLANSATGKGVKVPSQKSGFAGYP